MPRKLFAVILDRVQRFGVPPPLFRQGRAWAEPTMLGCWKGSAAMVRPKSAVGGLRQSDSLIVPRANTSEGRGKWA